MTTARSRKTAEERAFEEQIGARVGIWRRRRRLTAQELADRASLHLNTIYNVEKGEGCAVGTVARIAVALEIEVALLVTLPERNLQKIVEAGLRNRKRAASVAFGTSLEKTGVI